MARRKMSDADKMERYRAAAELFAQGMMQRDVAKNLGVSDSTISIMRREPAYHAVFREEMDKAIHDLKPVAIKVLREQMTTQNAWVAQNAANSLLRVLERAEQSVGMQVEVVWEGGMTQPMLPPDSKTAPDSKDDAIVTDEPVPITES